jgi:hypothetical protein
VGSPSDSGYSSSNIFFEASKNNSGSYVKLRTNTDNVIYLANNGYIGLGTDSPTTQLVLQTSGNTVDGTYYSTFTLKNTGTSTLSRMRFDRGTTAKWGLTHWMNDSFRISNLDKNGTGEADDTTLTILNNNNIGLGTDNPSTRLHVTSTTHTKLRVDTTGTADASVEILGYDAGVHIGDPTNGNRWAIWNDGISTSSSLKFGSYALGSWYADGSQAMTITSSGAVTKPVQPAWSVGLSGAQSFSTNVLTTINWNQSSGNDCFIQGGVSLNGDNGRITVPVGGKYMLFASIRTEATGAATGTNINLRRNGTTILRHYVGGAVNSGGSFMYIETRPIIVNCAANDYIDFYFDSVANDFTISATSNTVVRFGGFLMG